LAEKVKISKKDPCKIVGCLNIGYEIETKRDRSTSEVEGNLFP
jgi:hypothetical protein